MVWKLLVGEKEFILEPPKTIVGRSRSCDVRLREDTVSRLHAAFVFDEQGITVEDLGSSNGTFVNGLKVREPRRLVSGDRIRFGALKARLVGPEGLESGSNVPEPTWEYTVASVPWPPAPPLWRLAAVGLDILLYLLGSLIPFLPLLTMLVAERFLLRPETLPPDPAARSFVGGGCGALWVIYSWYYWLHGWARRGGTPGLRLLGLRLTSDSFRQPIGYRQAWIRAASVLATLMTLGLGFLFMFFRRDRKALHDILAKTRVVQKGNGSGSLTPS